VDQPRGRKTPGDGVADKFTPTLPRPTNGQRDWPHPGPRRPGHLGAPSPAPGSPGFSGRRTSERDRAASPSSPWVSALDHRHPRRAGAGHGSTVTVTHPSGATSGDGTLGQVHLRARPTVRRSVAHPGPDRRRHRGHDYRHQLHRGQCGSASAGRRPLRFTVVSATLDHRRPARPGAGTVDVTVTTGRGQPAPPGPPDEFTYVPRPTVSGLAPTQGPASGGTVVTEFTGTRLHRGPTSGQLRGRPPLHRGQRHLDHRHQPGRGRHGRRDR